MSDSGGRQPKASFDEVLEFLRSTDERVVTTPEVAEALNVSRRTALRRLSSLAESGQIERKDISERAAVWWLEDEHSDDAPAAPFKLLVGLLDEDDAADARERSQRWREEVNARMRPDATPGDNE